MCKNTQQLDYYQFSFADDPKPCFYSLVVCWSKGLPGNNTFNIDTNTPRTKRKAVTELYFVGFIDMVIC